MSTTGNSRLGYQTLNQVQTPQLVTKKTNEQRFWKKYLSEELKTQHADSLISSISTNKNAKDLMLIGHGRTVTMANTKTVSVVKQFSNFSSNITAVNLRVDGAVMAIGDEIGKIEIMDTKQKFRLRSFHNHKKRINCVEFSTVGGIDQALYSVSDDMTVRQYDIAAGTVINSYDKIHDDYIKCVKSISNNTILTGSYDGTIKMCDVRNPKSPIVSNFNHNSQVQWLDIFPSLMSFVSCGEKQIILWDIRKNQALNQHNAGKKVISCVRVALDGSRILTSSYDQHFKTFKSDNFELTFQQKLDSPISTFDIDKDNLCIGLGLENRKIIMKKKATSVKNDDQSDSEQEVEDQIGLWFKNNLQKNKAKTTLNDKYFYRGIYEKPSSFEIMFERNQSKKIGIYDKMLKKFHYKKALITALRNKNMNIFLALIDEYIQRGCLDRTIKSFSEAETEEVVQMLKMIMSDVRYSETVMLLITKIINLHGDKLGNQSFRLLKKGVQEQLDCIRKMKEISGMLEFIENVY